MMRYMRQNAVFVLVVVVLVVGVFIGTIFLVWGRGSLDSGGGERSVVAWIGKTEVPYAEFLRAHDTRMEFYRRFYPNLSQAEVERRFKVRRGALDAVVGRRLLIDEGRRLGVVATDAEVAEKIRGTAAFQDESGAFSSERYRQVLAASQVSPTAFEEDTRGEILVEKVRALAGEPARVSDEEALASFREEREKVRLELLLVPAPAAGAAGVSTEEARAAFDADPGKYRRPARLQVAWFAVRAADFQPAEPAGDEELRAWYGENEERFRSDREVHARHILFRLEEGAPADEERKIRDRASLVHEKVRAGADFAELAKEFSQDASGPRGGDLGWFERGRMVPAFEEAAFALGAGETSDLVRTPFGIHIIRVEEVREPRLRPFEEVAGEVRALAAAERARRAAAERAEQVNEELYGEEFEDVAQRHGLEVTTTGLLGRDETLPGAAAQPDVADALFALGPGDVSEFYRQGDDHYVYKVIERLPAAIPTFEEARAEVEADLVRERDREGALAAARGALEELAAGAGARDVACRLRGEVRATVNFARREFVSEAGVGGELFRDAFAEGAEGWLGPVALPDGRAVLYRVAGRIEADAGQFAEEKESIRERLLGEKRELLFDAWLADLRRARGVKLNEALLGPLDGDGE